MFRKLLILILFSFSMIFVSAVYAFEPFIKSPSNPLPFTNNFQNWAERDQFQPSALFDNGVYKMWYASYTGSLFKIIYATSSDGINWFRQNLLDLYPGFDTHDPAILKTQNGFTLFFVTSISAGSQTFKIYKMDSLDGVNFDSNSRQLVLQPTGNLESNAVSSPSVLFENGTYYLYYLCWGDQGFRVCLATSTDGSQWQRCPNNPIISEVSDGPNIFAKDGKHYLFFQSPLGVRQTETTDSLSCNSIWSNFQTVLPDPIIGPSIVENQNILYLYYTGFEPSGLTIDLATSNNQSSPTPTFTLTPTPTPLNTKNIIVIVPGMMSSWNKEAMLHNSAISQDQWKLLPFVKEYEGLTKSLENLQYVKNKDYYIFAYDWRKNLDGSADDLSNFLITKNLTSSQIDLIGHSLGGLVVRIFGQKFGTNSVNKIITVGSPHLGTAKTYKLVEAGEIERDNSIIWLMQKLVFSINRKNFETDKDTVQKVIPVAKDLFPIYDFLTDSNNNLIPIQSMTIKNTSLLQHSVNFPQLFPKLSAIAGEKDNTLLGFKVGQKNLLDALFDNYPDGRPIENRYDIGDGVITSLSALAGNDFTILTADHGEIIYKSKSVKTILDKLNIPYKDNQIAEGKATKVTPSIIFALLSSAEMRVDFNNQQYHEQEGLIFIENAQAGDYTLKVKGKAPGGQYAILIGQISEDEDKWFKINGEINKLFPILQTDTYIITFSPQSLLDFPVNQNDILSLFDLLIKKLNILNKEYNQPDLDEAIEELKYAKSSFSKKKFKEMRRQLIESHEEIFELRRKAKVTFRNELYEIIYQFENLYDRTSDVSNYIPTRKELQKKLTNLTKEYSKLEEHLLEQKNKKKKVSDRSVSLTQMNDKLQKAQEELSKNNLPLSEILLLSAERLSQEVK